MNIGIGTKNEAGHLEFPTVAFPFLRAERVVLVKAEKTKDASPDYQIHLGTADGPRCGAIWKRTPNGGGDAYLQGTLESPAFPGGRAAIAIFASKDEAAKGQLDMVWSPPKNQPTTPAHQAPAAEGDDEIPF